MKYKIQFFFRYQFNQVLRYFGYRRCRYCDKIKNENQTVYGMCFDCRYANR